MSKYHFQPRNSSGVWIRCCTSRREKLSGAQPSSYLVSLLSPAGAGQLWKRRAWLNLPVSGFFLCKTKFVSLLCFSVEGEGILLQGCRQQCSLALVLSGFWLSLMQGFHLPFFHPLTSSAAPGDTGMTKD